MSKVWLVTGSAGLGSGAVQYAGQAEATRAADAERRRGISVSTDFDGSRSVPNLRL